MHKAHFPMQGGSIDLAFPPDKLVLTAALTKGLAGSVMLLLIVDGATDVSVPFVGVMLETRGFLFRPKACERFFSISKSKDPQSFLGTQVLKANIKFSRRTGYSVCAAIAKRGVGSLSTPY